MVAAVTPDLCSLRSLLFKLLLKVWTRSEIEQEQTEKTERKTLFSPLPPVTSFSSAKSFPRNLHSLLFILGPHAPLFQKATGLTENGDCCAIEVHRDKGLGSSNPSMNGVSCANLDCVVYHAPTKKQFLSSIKEPPVKNPYGSMYWLKAVYCWRSKPLRGFCPFTRPSFLSYMKLLDVPSDY